MTRLRHQHNPLRVLVAAVVLGLGLAAAPSAAPPAEAAAPYVYLTFDDGPHATWTPRVLSVLSKYKVPATFFVVGQQADRYPSIVRSTYRAGHRVQNHTWSHPDLRKLSWTSFRSQITRTDAEIKAATGVTPKCVRPPYGATNSTVRSRLASLGKTQMLWTVDPRDWSRPGTSTIVNRVIANVRSGSVVLLHDGGGDRSQTVAALSTIISRLKAKGFTFRALCNR